MKPNLYICHTAYQVLVDLLRAGRVPCEGGPHTMVLSARVADAAALAARLDAVGTVKTVLVDETKWPCTVTGPFAHLRARRAFERLCGWKLDRAAYENIYIHNDWSVLGRYLQDCRAGYILSEDTFASTLGPDQHLVTDQRAAANFAATARNMAFCRSCVISPSATKLRGSSRVAPSTFSGSGCVRNTRRTVSFSASVSPSSRAALLSVTICSAGISGHLAASSLSTRMHHGLSPQ